MYVRVQSGRLSRRKNDMLINPPPPRLPKQALAEELGPLYAQGQLDGFNLYVYGIVLRALRPPALLLGGGGSGGGVEDRPRYA